MTTNGWADRVGQFHSLDLETWLIEVGLLAPPIVCGSTSWVDGAEVRKDILLRDDAVEEGVRLLRRPDVVVVGANVAYDVGCLLAAGVPARLVLDAYEEGRVYDVQIAQALHAIAEGNLGLDPETGDAMRGRYSLDACVRLVLGRRDAKQNDAWRLRYRELDGVPLDRWPAEARQYPLDDAWNTLEVARAQVVGGGGGVTPGPHRNLGDLAPQAYSALCLHLGAVWGVRVDLDRVRSLRERSEALSAAFRERFRGFVGADGRKNTRAVKRAVVLAYGGSADRPCPAGCSSGQVLSPKTGNAVGCPDCGGTGLALGAAPRTASGGVSCDRDALAESGDPDLADFGDNEHAKTLETYLPKIEGEEAGRWLRPNVLVASGRTSYDGVIQLMPRSGEERACFRARGAWCGSPVEYYFSSVDYAAIELCTLAQVCLLVLGRSQMAETINATGDPGALHSALGARMRGWTTEEMLAALKSADPKVKEEAKKYRQAAKAANFGFPGGMGPAKLVLANRKKAAGATTLPDGTVLPGVRLCVLLRGAEHCGTEKVTEWNKRPTPPICRTCVEVAEDLRRAWFESWPEMKAYFSWVSDRVGEFGRGELPCFGTARVRGGLDFTNGANNGFQALASDGGKAALRALTRECVLGEQPDGSPSPLRGAHPIFFVHDEIFSEVPAETAHLSGPRIAEVMVAEMRRYVPDVCVRAESALMRYWYKAAEPVYVDGKLVPWEPARTGGAT